MMTPEQATVARTPGSQLVVAGAGTGKTTTMVSLVEHGINQGKSPHGYLLLTFTRMAALELKQRLSDRLGDQANGIMTGTFHSVALSILQEHGRSIGLRLPLRVIDAQDAKILFDDVAMACGYLTFDTGGRRKYKQQLSQTKLTKRLNDVYANNIPDKMLGHAPLDRCILTYLSAMRLWGLLDFGSILRHCNLLLQEFPAIRDHERRKYHTIVVDELQDTDMGQYQLHNLLSGDGVDLVGVGDQMQCIYEWRGAAPGHMVEQFGGYPRRDLSICFRCSPDILMAANNLALANDPSELWGPLMPSRDDGDGHVGVMTGRTADIVQQVDMMAKSLDAFSDLAVLTRDNSTAKRIEREIRANTQVPVKRVGQSFDITSSHEFRYLISMMSLMNNANDGMAALRLAIPLGCPEILNWQSVQGACIEIGEDRPSVRDFALQSAIDNDIMETVNRFADQPDRSTGDVVRACVASLSNAHASIETQYLEQSAELIMSRCLQMRTVDLVNWFGLMDGQDDHEVFPNAVAVMTVHQAKGLEWDRVLIANCNEGWFPTARSVREGTIHQEARLMYVAMTRAKRHLVCHYRTEDQQSREPKPPSRFLYDAELIT